MASVRTGMGTVLAAGLLFLVGCGGNPLDGSWSTSTTTAGVTTKETVDLKDDASATISFKVTQTPQGITCSGSIDYTGFDWSSTETNITVSGSASCKTSLVCMVAGQPLASSCTPASNVAGTCHYKLSSDQNTFDLSNCTNQKLNGLSYTRDEM